MEKRMGGRGVDSGMRRRREGADGGDGIQREL